MTKLNLNKITVIKLKISTREALKKLKYNERESYDSIIQKMIKKIKDKDEIVLFEIGKSKKEKIL